MRGVTNKGFQIVCCEKKKAPPRFGEGCNATPCIYAVRCLAQTCIYAVTILALAREEPLTTTTAMFECWRWKSCWYWCSRRAGQAAAPQDLLAAAKMRDALKSLEAALGEWGAREGRGAREEWGGDALMEARRLLEAPCAKSAASALIMIGGVAQSCDEEAECAIKAAERAVRDVVVLRLRSRADPADRKAFLKAAEEVFGRPGQRLDQEFQACLLLAFHKLRRA